MATKETPTDTKPVKTVTVSLDDVLKKIRGKRNSGNVMFSEPDDKGLVTVSVKAVSKAGPDHPHKGRFYPVEGSFTIPEKVIEDEKARYGFGLATYSVFLDHGTTYRDTEAGTKPKVIKTTASTVKSERAYLVEQGVAPEQVDLIIAALDKKAGK